MAGSVNRNVSGSGTGGPVTILIGGNRLIFLPCRPVFRCHNPDLGR